MLALFAKDAEVRTQPFDAPLAGSLDIRAHWNAVAAEQATVEFDAERIWVAGRTVLSSWHEAFTRRATGERVRVRAFSTFELDEAGLIVRLRCWPNERVVAVDIPDLDGDATESTRAASHG
jgi:hypothetical protein